MFVLWHGPIRDIRQRLGGGSRLSFVTFRDLSIRTPATRLKPQKLPRRRAISISGRCTMPVRAPASARGHPASPVRFRHRAGHRPFQPGPRPAHSSASHPGGSGERRPQRRAWHPHALCQWRALRGTTVNGRVVPSSAFRAWRGFRGRRGRNSTRVISRRRRTTMDPRRDLLTTKKGSVCRR